MRRNLLHSYSISYKNAIDLITCYRNHEINEPLVGGDSIKSVFTNNIAPLKNFYTSIEFEIEEHDLNSRQLSRGVTLNIFGVISKPKNACCDEDWVSDESEINGRCSKCGELTINGKAATGCSWSPTVCEECGASPCDGSC